METWHIKAASHYPYDQVRFMLENSAGKRVGEHFGFQTIGLALKAIRFIEEYQRDKLPFHLRLASTRDKLLILGKSGPRAVK